jgi:hypothetical protein
MHMKRLIILKRRGDSTSAPRSSTHEVEANVVCWRLARGICSAPLCPLADNHGRVWFPGEDYCRLRSPRQLHWVAMQRRTAKLHRKSPVSGSFSVEDLERIVKVRKGICGRERRTARHEVTSMSDVYTMPQLWPGATIYLQTPYYDLRSLSPWQRKQVLTAHLVMMM